MATPKPDHIRLAAFGELLLRLNCPQGKRFLGTDTGSGPCRALGFEGLLHSVVGTDCAGSSRGGHVVIDDIGLALPLPWRYDVDGFRVYSPF